MTKTLQQNAPSAQAAPSASPAIDAQSVADHWSKKTKTSPNWWTSKRVVREYNRRVCGRPHNASTGGIRELIQQRAGRPVERAISVGCGNGGKEVDLLRSGTVRHITGFDLAPVRIEHAKQVAQEHGVAERADFRVGDAFKEVEPGFDMVFWAAALHHMEDTAAAIRWSRSMLKSGGIFAMDEYVGPNQFQISKEHLSWVNRVRGAMPSKVFARENRAPHAKQLTFESLSAVCRKDPSEAYDSGAILKGVRDTFPMAEIKPAGGMLFFIALNGLYAGLDPADETDNALLDMILMMDGQDVQRRPDTTLYAAAIASI